ncbi:hypothetical protein E3E36_07670 [Thermococcus sp. M36]|uniref:hypothetical protein n=1 Tax=Thermococcus sp. M36 TaxID=1638261 RepID=UPI00143A0DFD|nr:hypothetical protein [Thermococcus sp. M36]NJE06017.1 hypothetical protein [Thermococcus sp. M36]
MKPRVGGAIFYALLGFLGGFSLTLILGMTLPLPETVRDIMMAALPLTGLILALYYGKKSNYTWWPLFRFMDRF